LRRAARTLGVVVLAALALGALLVGSALTILRTDWGGELARRAALPRINHALAGSVQLQRLRYGGDHLSLEGIVLRDPEGRLVARVRSIEVAFSPLGLLRGQVRVPRLSVVAPALYLRSDPEGLNLARALAPRAPGRPETAEAPATSSGGGGLTVDIGGFRIVDGSVELRVPATATGVRASEPLAASGIAVDGRVRYEAGPAAFEASIRAAADVAKPVRARFDLRIAGHGRGERRRVDLRAGLGESTLAAELQTESEDRATLRGVRLHVVPRLVAAVAPAVGLLAPVDVAADVTRTGPVAEIASDLRSAGAHLEARATVDMGAARARPFAIRASDVDLGRIFAGLPRSDLSLTARGEAQGRDLEQLSGVLELHLPEGRLAGAPVGPIAMIVSANRGQLDIRELRAALPGLTITGHGPAGPARMDLQIAAEALDLGITSRVLSSFPGLGAPPFGGRGRIDLALAGTSRAPAATIRAAFPALRLAEHCVRRLTLEARIPDARTPPVADASLHVVEARLGGRSIRDASIHVRSAPPRLVADVSLKGAAPLALSLSGRWGSDRQSFELDRLRLRYPEATWTSSGRARLSWTPGDLALSGLDLRSGNQRIRASLAQRGARLRAAVGLERVDLGQLPKVAVPPGLTVGGQLDLDGELTGTMRDGLVDPRARLTVSLRNGRVGRTRDLALELEGRYVGRRATGHLEARGLGTSLAGRFDLPMTWPLPDTAAPLALDFSLPETDLAGALEAAGVHLPRRLAGRAAVALRLEGTGRAPVLRLDTTARALVVDGQALGDLSLHVTGGGGAPLQASLDVRGSGQRGRADGVPLIGTGRLDARTDLPLGVLARRPPSAAELTRARFDVTGDLRGVPLAALARLAGSPEVSAGTAALRISASGSARDPRGAVNVELAGAAGPRFPPTDARLDASFGERDTRVALRVTRNARELLSASGILGVGAHRLRDVAALSAAPVTLAAALGPLRLHRDAIAGALDAAGSVPLSTEARARLSVGGTLERPQITMAVTLADARLGTRPLGEARLLATYADRRADADLVIRGPGTTGKLHLTNRTAIDLGYPALMRGGGVDPGHLGLDARLTADHFDLAWLSGITDQVSRVAGQLSATIAAKGPVGAPRVNGQLEWSDGAVGLRGLGDYQQVHLKAHGSGEALVIDELKLASGEGKARLTAQVTRGAAGGNRGLAGQAQVSLSRFPIYGQGQVLALVSADGSAKSDATAAEVNATVTLSEAHVELTDAKQKDLMPLQRPADVVLLDGGRPLDPKEARKLSAVADVLSLGAGAGEPEGASPPPERAPVSPLQAHVAVHAPRNLWVRGKDASLELGLGSSFRVELGGGGAPRIYGRVLIRRGRLDVLGRRFDLQAGSQVQFVGPADAPRLDVSAKHFNETENVGVLLTVRGTPDKVSVAVSSPERPDLTEGQLYALIVTGRLQFGGNTAGSAGMSGQAASLVGGLVAAQLQKALAKRLPLDVLTLQAGEGLTGSRLEAGTYLTSKLYAGYVGRVGANPALLQNRNAVHLEYQLSRRWSFDGEYGDVGTGTADLVWTKHY